MGDKPTDKPTGQLWSPPELSETQLGLKYAKKLGSALGALGILLDMIDEGCDIGQLKRASERLRKYL